MKKLRIFTITAVTVLFFFMMYISPVTTTILSKNNVSYDNPISSIAHTYAISQQFIPQYDYVESIEICVNTLGCSRESGHLRILVLDADMNTIYENNIPISDMPDFGFTPVVSRLSLEAGSIYYLKAEAIDTIDDGPVVSFYPTMIAASAEENGCRFTYAEIPLENSVLKANFIYRTPISLKWYSVYYLFLLFIILFVSENLSKNQVEK